MLKREDEGGIARLTLARPEKLNALSDDMLASLRGALAELAEDDTARVVILAAEGKAFCAGHDLKEMQARRQAEDAGAEAFRELFERCSDVMLALRRLPQPVIAEVQGVAAAAGCQLVASCDMAVAAEEVKFGVNGVNIGLFCSTPMVALTRAVPAKRAFEMLATGRMIDAEEAREIGLVNRVVPAGDLTAATRDLAETVAGKLGSAVRIGKRAFYEQADLGEAEAYEYAGEVMTVNMMNEDTNEGIAAFLDKRKPAWAG